MEDKKQAHKWREGDGAFIRTNLVLEPMPEMEETERGPFKVHALPWGEIDLRDKAAREYWDEPGTLEVNDRTSAEVEENFSKRDTDFFVNLNHDRHGKAYGWIEGVEVVKDEGINIAVDWTAEGRDLVSDRAYKYSSIEVILDASSWAVDGSPAVVVAVTGLALTNNPAVVGQTPIAYQTLTAALSGSDPQSREGKPTPRNTGGKGDCPMDGNFFKGLLSGVFGREPKDEVDAATMAAELKEIRGNHDKLTAELEASTSKTTELTEKLATVTAELSEFKAKEAEIAKAGTDAKVEAAVKDGRLHMAQLDAAKEDPESFLKVAESTEPGTFSPPKGQQVTDAALDKADTASLAADGDKEAIKTEISVLAEKENIGYADARDKFYALRKES